MAKKRKKSGIAFAVMIIIAVVIAAVAGVYIYNIAADDINGKDQTHTEYNLVLSATDEQYQVGQKLYRAGIVINDSLWTNWMDKHYPDFKYEGGEYMLTSDMAYEDIAAKLNNPDISHKAVKVCIPEGYNCMEIADTLEKNNVCIASDFLNVCKSTSGFEYDFLDSVPQDGEAAYKLEGFLFPATYDLEENTDPSDVADYMLDTFERHITDEMLAFCDDNDMTLYELITLASIVQEEALGASSAGKISSVFMNRLNNGTKLQSDVTYFYAKKLRDEMGFSQEVYDAYYTYNCAALPAGPISNSGDDIMSATVHYPDTDYLYFFSDLEQEFHFAETYDEFMRLQQKYPWKK